MPISSHQAQVPALVREYFADPTPPAAYDGEALRALDRIEHPVVAQTFAPGRGWKTTSYRKRVSASWLRKLRAEGVTAVGLRSGARLADFTIDEVLSHQSRIARQPLLGGSVI